MIVDPEKKELVPKAVDMFTDWFNMYKVEDTEIMDAVAIGKFVTNATRQSCDKDDNRVKGIIDTYAKTEESKAKRQINLEEFLEFYKDAASATDLSRVKAVK